MQRTGRGHGRAEKDISNACPNQADAVHPDHQRRGYGQAILNALLSRAKQFGYQVIHLDTTTLQTAAQRLYEKNGFNEIGRKQIDRLTVIFYEKRLADLGPG